MITFAEVEEVVIDVCANVVIDSLIGVTTDELSDVFVDMRADLRADLSVKVGLSDVEIAVVAAAVIALDFAVLVS